MTWRQIPEEIYSRIFYRELRGTAREGAVLYLLTLGVELVIGGGIRWALAYLALATLGLGEGWLAAALPWAFALGGIPYSLIGFARPKPGIGRMADVRPPTELERAALSIALEQLRSIYAARGPDRWHVADSSFPGAAASGRDIIVSSSLVWRETLPSVIAHELGHVETIDARLTAARWRLPLWQGPRWADNRADDEDGKEALGPLLLVASLVLRLASGSVSLELLGPLWRSWAYQREFAADEYTIRFAEHWGLVRYFRETLDLGGDTPMIRLLNAISNHPPTKERMWKLEHWADRGAQFEPDPPAAPLFRSDAQDFDLAQIGGVLGDGEVEDREPEASLK